MAQPTGIDKLCIDTIRTLSMDAVQKANSGHPGAPIALAPLAYLLYTRYLRHDPTDPAWPNRDRFVLSAGHASMLLYSALHLSGYDLSLDDIKAFRQLHSKTPGHPEYGITPGVETTTGPLGQGAANSVGMAIAEKWMAAYFNRPGHEIVNHRVWAVLGDGCMMEGVTGEAASLAGHLGLDNLIWIYDNNQITIDGRTSICFSEDVGKRFESYHWRVRHVKDINDVAALAAGLDWAGGQGSGVGGQGSGVGADGPTLLIVDSVIAWGAPTRAGTSKAHGEPLGDEEIIGAKKHYGWDAEKKFYVPDEVRAHWTRLVKERGAAARRAWQATFDAYAAAHAELAQSWHTMQRGELPAGWDRDIPTFPPDAKGLATRVSAGKVLNAIAAQVPWLMGGAADLASSTKTRIEASGDFQNPLRQGGGQPSAAAKSPDPRNGWHGRNINFGVREHAMAAIANGMALSKMRPYVSSFLTFTDYCRPSIRLSALMGLPVIYVFTHDSIALGEDGPTHQPVEHVAALRAIPNLDVYRPADANEAAETWLAAMRTTDRPVLMALTRQNVPTFDRAAMATATGVARGAYVLADGPGKPDLILMGTGSEVQLCLAARDALGKEGISIRVVSMTCWETFERQDAAYRDSVLPPTVTRRVAIEAGVAEGWHNHVGTQGAVIALSTFGASAPEKAVMNHYGFTAEHVVTVCRDVLKFSRDSKRSANPDIRRG